MKINNKWMMHHGALLRWTAAAVVALVVIFTAGKRCTQVGRPAAEDVYVPSSDEGFVMKANIMLKHLVEKGNNDHADIHPHSITELQKRYPAFEFALPYGENAVEGARAADIRLVGINPDSIDNEDDKKFFYNSDIPTLLSRQKANLGDRIFRITFAGTKDLAIGKIEIPAAMFKVALAKTPWAGAVVAAESALFPQENHCFLTWGKTVVPIKQSGKGHIASGGGHEKVVTADMKTHTLTMQKGKPIDYYKLYKAYQADTTTVCVRIPGEKETAIYIDYTEGGKIRVRPVGCFCQPYDASGPKSEIAPMSAAMKGQEIPLDNLVKLVLNGKSGGSKICEFTVARQNPMLMLSTLVNSNEGLKRYSIAPNQTDKFTQQILRGLATSLENTVYKDTVKLSIDPLLSMEMEDELEKYARKLMAKPQYYSDDQWELSLTVMDMATGEIVAAPYYRSADKAIDYQLAISRKNPALTRRFVGSAFKPLVALAAVLTKPGLDTLNTVGKYKLLGAEGKGKPKASFFGHETTAWAAKGSTASFWNGCPSMSAFLAKSDDVYPVALVAKALNYGGTGSPFLFKPHEVMLASNENFTWAGSKFVNTIDHLYTIPGLADYMAHDSLQMAYYTWDNIGISTADKFGLDNVSPDPTLLYYDNFNRNGATMHNELATWVLGQGTNEWNCLKLAEAWTRMLTKRKVTASLVKTKPMGQFANLAEGYDDRAWNSLLASLLRAQSTSPKLLSPMNDAVKTLNNEEHIADTLLLFSKTGTPDNYLRTEWKSVTGGPRWLDVGLYCMALMPKSSYNAVRQGKNARGLMCVVRVTRIVSNKHRNVTSQGNDNGIQSSDARNFFSANIPLLRKFYTMTKDRISTPHPQTPKQPTPKTTKQPTPQTTKHEIQP